MKYLKSQPTLIYTRLQIVWNETRSKNLSVFEMIQKGSEIILGRSYKYFIFSEVTFLESIYDYLSEKENLRK